MAEELEIKGFKEISKKLKKLPTRIRNRVVGKALRKAGRPMLLSARGKAPIDEGLIKKNIKTGTRSGWRAGPNADVVLKIGVDTPKPKGKRSLKGLRQHMSREERKEVWGAYYWIFWEFGSSKTPAQSFLRSAFDENATRAIFIARREMRKGIAKEARKP
mgnify:CR=1 FL=1